MGPSRRVGPLSLNRLAWFLKSGRCTRLERLLYPEATGAPGTYEAMLTVRPRRRALEAAFDAQGGFLMPSVLAAGRRGSARAAALGAVLLLAGTFGAVGTRRKLGSPRS